MNKNLPIPNRKDFSRWKELHIMRSFLTKGFRCSICHQKNENIRICVRLALCEDCARNYCLCRTTAMRKYILNACDLDNNLNPMRGNSSRWAGWAPNARFYLIRDVTAIAMAKWGSWDELEKERKRRQKGSEKRLETFRFNKLLRRRSLEDGLKAEGIAIPEASRGSSLYKKRCAKLCEYYTNTGSFPLDEVVATCKRQFLYERSLGELFRTAKNITPFEEWIQAAVAQNCQSQPEVEMDLDKNIKEGEEILQKKRKDIEPSSPARTAKRLKMLSMEKEE